MKKTDVNLKILIAIILVFGLSFSLMAQPGTGHDRPHRMGHHGLAMLDLSDDQKTDIKEIHLTKQKEIQPLKDELKINRAKINALVKKDDPDMKEIVSLVESNGKLLTQIQVKQIERKIEVRALLTEEQKIIFDSRPDRMKHRRAMVKFRHGQGPRQRNRF